jgi:hypothetical protein
MYQTARLNINDIVVPTILPAKLDGEHESFYRRCCQLIEVKREEGLTP